MFIRLFLLFTIVPLIELSLLLKLGTVFGVLHTVALVILTGVLGAYLARDQGLRVLGELQQSLREGRAPTDPIIEGALVIVSAALLVTPGVLTDAVGFLLVIPHSRRVLRDFLKTYFIEKIRQGAYQGMQSGGWFVYRSSQDFGQPGPRRDRNNDDIIDI